MTVLECRRTLVSRCFPLFPVVLLGFLGVGLPRCAAAACTTDTVRIVGITADDTGVFPGFSSHDLVSAQVEMGSDDLFASLPDYIHFRAEILDDSNTVVGSTDFDYPVSYLIAFNYVYPTIEFADPSHCLPSGTYHWHVAVDPDEVTTDCVRSNNTIDSSPFNMDMYAGTLDFGGIETQITSVSAFNYGSHLFYGTATWNGSVNLSPSGITIAPESGCVANVVAGSVPFTLPQPVQPGNWPYESTNGVLDSTGARVDASIDLPSSVIYKSAIGNPLWLERPVDLGMVKLHQDFIIDGSHDVTSLLPEVKAENQPFSLYNFSSVVWSELDGFVMQDGKIRYLHEAEFAADPGPRVSNDFLFFNVGTIANSLSYIDPTGLSVNINYPSPGYVFPGFPDQTVVEFHSAVVSIENSLIASGTIHSFLTGILYTSGSCFGGALDTLEPFGTGDMQVAPDGAISGAVTSPSLHEFTYDAYQLHGIVGGDFYLPGFMAVGKASGFPNPAEYLLAGRLGPDIQESNFAMYGEDSYTKGDGLYAGYNLSQSQLQGKGFTVTIACANLNMTLSPYSKLYARYGGFNGTMDAAGGLPADLQLYGEYATTLSRFNISILDNQQALDSHVEGQIHLPFPSSIDLPFTKMELKHCGDIGKADVANVDRTLAYWNAHFLFAGLEFKPTGGTSSCGTQLRTLFTTSSNTIPRVGDAVLLETNFHGDGDITGNKLLGEPGNTVDGYKFNVRRIFYSHWNGQFASNDGLTVLIGDIGLPYWGMTPVKTLVDAGGTSHMFQGRNFAASPPVDNDLDQDGYPDGSGYTTPAQYEADSAYYPNVKGSFANLISLNYPVVYNSLLKRFASPKTQSQNLIAIDIESSVKTITQQNTEVLFGVKYQGLPTLNLSQVVSDYTKPAITSVLGPIKQRVDQIGNSLNGNLSDAIRSALSDFLDPFVQSYLDQVKTAVDTIPPGPALDSQLDTLRSNFISGLQSNLQNYLRGATGPIQGQAKQVLNSLDQLDSILDGMSSNQVHDLLAALIQLTGHDSSGVDAVFGNVENARTAIRAILKDQIRPPIQNLLNEINSLDRFTEIDDILSDSTQFNGMMTQLDQAVSQYVNSVKANKALVRNLSTKPIKDAILNAIFDSSLFSSIVSKVNTLFAPLKQQMTDSILSFLDVINNAVNEYLDQIGAAVNNQITSLNNVVGVKAAKLNGYAVFSAQSLDRLHIGAEFQMATPDTVKFTGALDMERIHRQGTGATCGVPDTGDTIKAGIKVGGIPISFGIGDMNADIGILLTLTDSGSGTQLRNFAGSIDCTGSVGFASVQLIDPGFGVGVGADENYFYFTGKVKMDGSAAKGGIFLGRTCNGLDILKKIDPEVGDVLKVNEMFGIFTSAEAAVPIVDYGCFLRAGASVGAGFWYFVNGPQYGAKLTGGLYGEAACVVSVRGKLTLIGAKDAAGYVLSGNAWVAGGIGFCSPEDWFTPADAFNDDWCAVCVAYMKIIYRPKSDWNVSYDVDCSL